MRLLSQTLAQLALVQGRITYADKLLDLRLKQLELFFAPLHALLQQSKGVYAKLTMQLLEDSVHYQQVADPAVPEVKTLQVRWSDGRWYDWRLLDQMPPLQRDRMYRPLIDEIMRIGKEMTALIQNTEPLLSMNRACRMSSANTSLTTRSS